MLTKYFAVLALIGALLIRSDAQEGNEPPDEAWVDVVRHEFCEHRVRRPTDTAYMGACALAFRMAEHIQGSLIIDNDHLDSVTVFMGWGGFANQYITTAPHDGRLAFRSRDGQQHTVNYIGGGGHGLLFRSPDAVDLSALQDVTLQRRNPVTWLGD